MTTDDRVDDLRERRERARQGGGEDRIEAQHERGKGTARERIDQLVDDGTFHELDRFRTHDTHAFGMEERRIPGDGVVTGHGEVNGRQTFVIAHDFTAFGGSIGEVFAEKVTKVLDRAERSGAPVVTLNDSAGARIQEGVRSLAGVGEIFRRNVDLSGVVPQISCIMGPCAGGAVYSPALTDFVVMVEDTSHMFVTGPDVVETVTGEQVSFEELGGARAHADTSGVTHLAAADETAALDAVRRLLAHLPQNNVADPPRTEPRGPPTDAPAPGDVVPAEPREPYDATEVVASVVDGGELFQVHERFARNVVVGFARLDGRSVGVVANQPRVSAGTLDIEASQKAARFVRTCDAFNVPVLTFVDVPGFMPGTEQEHGGIIRHGAKLLYAYAEATVPLLTVVTRKAYGGAYDVMASTHLGADANYAWPTAEIAVMGPRGAVNLLYGDEIDAADDPDARRDRLVEEYREEFATPYVAADEGYLDDVIEPGETRDRLAADLELLAGKRGDPPDRKHGNPPL